MNIFKKNDEWSEKPRGSNWKKVLHIIYNYAPKHFENIQTMADEFKISVNEVTSALEFLKNQDLIKVNGKEDKHHVITEKGFNVALQNEIKLQELRTQALIFGVSLVVLFVNASDLVIRTTPFAPVI